MSRKILISSNKGGVLKTSLTVSLGGVLSQKGKKVLIIDSDNQGNAAVSFGLNPDQFELTLYDVLVEGLNPKDAIINVYENIDLLPSNDDMSFLEFDVLSNTNKYPNPFYLLKKAFSNFDLSKYDYVLLDSPPNIGLATGNCLVFADEVLVPFQPEAYSMRSLVKIIQAVNNFKVEHNDNLKILGVVGTLVDTRTNLHSQILQECRRYCLENNIQMFDTTINKSVRFASSIAYEKLPATLTDKNHPLVKSYYELYEEVF